MKFKKYVKESVEDMSKRCENCNTLLNDGGTCPKCDEGEEDYGDETEVIEEELDNLTKLKIAYPELNFDDSTEDTVVVEELTNLEKLKRAYPELDIYDSVVLDSSINENTCVKEQVTDDANRSLKDIIKESTEENTEENIEETVEEDYSNYDDDYDIDDVEADRIHTALYGGDREYCSCGKRLAHNEWGAYCPVCDSDME